MGPWRPLLLGAWNLGCGPEQDARSTTGSNTARVRCNTTWSNSPPHAVCLGVAECTGVLREVFIRINIWVLEAIGISCDQRPTPCLEQGKETDAAGASIVSMNQQICGVAVSAC